MNGWVKMLVGMVSTSYIIRKLVIVKMEILGWRRRKKQIKKEEIFTKQKRGLQRNKHKLVHISCEVKFSQSTWAFICNYLTRYLPQYKKDGAGTKSFCKGKIKLMLKDLKNGEPPWWMSNLAEWLEHWCMLVKHPGARVRIHLMGHNYFPHSAYSQTELSSTLLQPKKL